MRQLFRRRKRLQPGIIISIIAIILVSYTLSSESAFSFTLSFGLKTIPSAVQEEPPKHESTMRLNPSGDPLSPSLHSAANLTSYNGNLTVPQGSSLQILNSNFTVNGYIFVYGNLTVINSTMSTFFPYYQSYDPLGLRLLDHAKAVFINSSVNGYVGTHNFSSLRIENCNFTQRLYYENLNFFDFSHVVIDNSSVPWIISWGNSTLEVDNSTIGALGTITNSKVSIYHSKLAELDTGDNTVSNVYLSSITHLMNVDMNASVFLWNTTHPVIGYSQWPSFSAIVFGSISTIAVSGYPPAGKPSFNRPLLDVGAVVAINGTSYLGGEVRFYWGTEGYTDVFQRLGVDKGSIVFLFWNGTGWQRLPSQGSVTSPGNRDGYFWGATTEPGIYALGGLRATGSLNYYLLLIPIAAVLLTVTFLLWRRRVKSHPFGCRQGFDLQLKVGRIVADRSLYDVKRSNYPRASCRRFACSS